MHVLQIRCAQNNPKRPSTSKQGWRVDGVVGWARARDFRVPAKVLHENGVNGQDLLDAGEAMMMKELRFTRFAAQNLPRDHQKRTCQNEPAKRTCLNLFICFKLFVLN